jgi:hypothetical protein
MGRLMALCGERLEPGTPVADRILAWEGDISPRGASVPLRLAGGLHALKRQGRAGLDAVYPPNTADDDALWACVEAALVSEETFFQDWLDSPPQTNEVRRSAAIIPALHMLAAHFDLPLHLSEIGCSGGLNLRADRFALTAGGQRYGPQDARVHLTPDWKGPTPPAAAVTVAGRSGVDLRPVDPGHQAERLLAYLWADQPDRMALTEAAIAEAMAHPAEISAMDALDWLPSALVPKPGVLHVLFHTIAWQYLPESAQKKGDAMIEAAGARATRDAPLARLSMENDGPAAAVRLQVWPGGSMALLGRACYHGRWVEWTRPSLADGAYKP